VRRLVLTTIGPIVFIDHNNLINKIWTKTYVLSNNGTEVCQQKHVIVHVVGYNTYNEQVTQL